MRHAVSKVRSGISLAMVEVEVLCRTLDIALPVGVPASVDTHAVYEVAVSGLAARGLVGIGPGPGPCLEVHDAVARTLRLASACREVRIDGGEVVMVGGVASISVRHGELGVVRLEPLPAQPSSGLTRSQMASTTAASSSDSCCSRSAAPTA